MENFGKFIATLIIMFCVPIMTGFVFAQLWQWILVPTFELQPLRLIEAIGIMLILGYVLIKVKAKKEPNDEFIDLLKGVVKAVVISGLALFYGWIITLFM